MLLTESMMPGVPLPNPVPRILHLRDPRLMPRYEFEWHEHTQKVYIIEFPVTLPTDDAPPQRTAEISVAQWCIAEHAEDHGRAYNLVQTFVRGFRLAKWGDRVGTK